MKMTKTILVAAAALAAFSFAGCKKAVGDVAITVNGTGTEASVDVENTGDSIIRGYKESATKHSGCTVDFTMANQTASSADGMMGVIFDLSENKDGTVNFYIVGIANYNGKARTYISRYENIATDSLSADNFGAGTGDAKETEILKLSTPSWANYAVDKDGNFKATVQITANATDNANGNKDNKWHVIYYPAGTTFEKDAIGYAYAKDGVTAYKDVAVGDIGFSDKITTDAAKVYAVLPQNKLAYYANVYAGKTLTGTWKQTTVLHEAVEE